MTIDSITAGAGSLGAQLRRLRTERDLTLAELGERTGLLVSTLSKAETGKISLSYDKLVRISEGLGIDIARLFARHETPEASPQPAVTTGRRSVSRAEDAPSVDIGTYHYVYPAAELLRKSLNPMVIDVKVRSIEAFGELMRHHGEDMPMCSRARSSSTATSTRRYGSRRATRSISTAAWAMRMSRWRTGRAASSRSARQARSN